MLKLTKLNDAPHVPFDLDGRIMFSSSKAEIVHLTLKPGEQIPEHANPFEVVFYLLEGEMELRVDDQSVVLTPNTSIHVDVNRNRSLVNRSENLCRILVYKIL